MYPKRVTVLFLMLLIFLISNLNAGEAPKNTLTGKVIDANGEPIANAMVAVRGANAKQMSTNTDGIFSTVIRSRISYIPKPYLLIRHVERNLAAVVELDDNLENLDITLSPGVIFSGKVVDVNGVGIQNAEIVLYFMVKEGVYEGGWPELIDIDPEGNFEIRAIPTDYEYSVGTRAEGYGNRSVKFRSGDAIEGRIDFKSNPLVLEIANQTVSGVVVDIDDQPVANASVFTGAPNQIVQTDKDGKFTIEKVCAGRIDISAEKHGTSLRGKAQTEGGTTDVKIVILARDTGNESVTEQPTTLVGKSLPNFEHIKVDLTPEQMKDKKILVCFFDIQQRPSRNCVIQLAKRAEDLAHQRIVVVGVHATAVENSVLKDWLEKNRISFPVGKIERGEDEVRFAWGVRSLPWLLLTDWKHIVRAEGFGIDELSMKAEESATWDAIEGYVRGPNGQPIAGAEVRINRDVPYYYPPETTQTDKQGFYSLPGASWPYRILSQWKQPLVSKKGYRRQLMELKKVFEGPQIINFQFNPFPEEDTIINGKVVDHNNNPVPEFKVWLYEINRRDDPDATYVRKMDYALEFTSENGVFKMVGLPQGDYRLNVYPISRNYDEVRLDVTLENDKTNECLVRLASKKAFHGRVLFEDGSPAVLPGSETGITEPVYEGSWATLASLDEDGYFVMYLSDDEIQRFESGQKQLWVLLQKYHVGLFPFEFLATERDKAGIVKVKRPERVLSSANELLGRLLPKFEDEDIDIEFALEQSKGKLLCVCFFDMQQRPSRNCLQQFSKRAQELKAEDVVVVAVQASKVDEYKLNEWVKDYSIPFPIGMVQADEEKTSFNWGVKSLPWLILTDKQHTVRAEGFNINALDEKITTLRKK